MRLHVDQCLRPAEWRVVLVGTDHAVDGVRQADDDAGWVERLRAHAQHPHDTEEVALPIEIQLLVDGMWVKPTSEQAEARLKRWTVIQVSEARLSHCHPIDGRIQLEASRQQGDLLRRAASFPELFRPSPLMTGPTLMKAVIAYIDQLERDLSTVRSLLDERDDQDQVEVTSVRELVEGSADTKDNVLVEPAGDAPAVYVAARLHQGDRITMGELGEVQVERRGKLVAGDGALSRFVELGRQLVGPVRPVQRHRQALPGITRVEDRLSTLRPMLYGTLKNIEPPVKGWSGETFSFEQELKAVTAVYDDGVPLKRADDASPTVKPGEYRAILHSGYIKLGARPKGRVTCDVIAPEGVVDRAAAYLGLRPVEGSIEAIFECASIAEWCQEKYQKLLERRLVPPLTSYVPEPFAHSKDTVVYAGRGFGKTEQVEQQLAKASAGGAQVVRLGGPKVHNPWPGRVVGGVMSDHDVMRLSEPDEDR